MKKEKTILVDQWIPKEEDILIFSKQKGLLQVPITNMGESLRLNEFVLSPKKAYSRKEFVNELCKYLNYFIAFYDKGKTLLLEYRKIKYWIDCVKTYSEEDFLMDIEKLIINADLCNSIQNMNNDNIQEHIPEFKEKSDNLMIISLMCKLVIPLITEFIFIKKIDNMNEFIHNIFKTIMDKVDPNIYLDLYSQCDNQLQRVQNLEKESIPKFALQITSNLIINIIPKYRYNIYNLAFNATSIKQNIRYSITDIAYGKPLK